ARVLGLPARLLRADALLRGVGGPALLAPYGAEAPLRVLIEDYHRQASLTLVGSIAARFDLQRLLRNLAALAEREARHPDLPALPIERPIFITGMPRSGTTFLHKLLAEDPANRFPAVWETMFPLPRGADDPPARRIATVTRQLAAFARMAPGFRAMHPIEATSPQECIEITAHVFRSFRFELTHHMPGYRRWMRAADHVPAYRFHRRFLQHLQYTDGAPRRWVVKAPDHVFTLDALAAVYPDARIVMLHRDPLEVLASTAGLTAILQRPFAAPRDPALIGRDVLGDWRDGAAAMLRAEERRLFPPDRILHLRFRDFIAAPVAGVARVYAHFNLPLGAEVRQRMERRVAALPRGGYGGLTHALARYGIDAEAARQDFTAYAARFGVATRQAPQAAAAGPS
ncbi:MAG: sulfotransferase, partial [Acetobacteraceae bacterium]|nr:sulfotransferase [Acetobacteraceae bacterium]